MLDLRSEVDKLTLQHQESTALQLYNAFLSLHQRLKQASLRQRQVRATRNVPQAWRPAAQPRPFVQVSRANLIPQNVPGTAPVPSRAPTKPATASPPPRAEALESDGDDDFIEEEEIESRFESENVSEDEEESDAFISSPRRRREYDDRDIELSSFDATSRRIRSKRSRDDVPVTRAEMRRYIEAAELSATLRRKTVDCTPLLVFYRLVVIILLVVRTYILCSPLLDSRLTHHLFGIWIDYYR